MTYPVAEYESLRLDAVRALEIVDTPPDRRLCRHRQSCRRYVGLSDSIYLSARARPPVVQGRVGSRLFIDAAQRGVLPDFVRASRRTKSNVSQTRLT